MGIRAPRRPRRKRTAEGMKAASRLKKQKRKKSAGPAHAAARAGQAQTEEGIQKKGAEDQAERKDRSQQEAAGKGGVQQEKIRDPAASDICPGCCGDHQPEENPDQKHLRPNPVN